MLANIYGYSDVYNVNVCILIEDLREDWTCPTEESSLNKVISIIIIIIIKRRKY